MTAQRWQVVESLFEHALELPEPERNVFLGDRCAGDLGLREEVRELLATAQDPGVSLREAVIAEAQARPVPPTPRRSDAGSARSGCSR